MNGKNPTWVNFHPKVKAVDPGPVEDAVIVTAEEPKPVATTVPYEPGSIISEIA